MNSIGNIEIGHSLFFTLVEYSGLNYRCICWESTGKMSAQL